MKDKKTVVIIGGGTGGTMVANVLARNPNYDVVVIDKHGTHYYQPGLLFIPFGKYKLRDIVKNRTDLLSRKVHYIQAAADRIDAPHNKVVMEGGKEISYDILVVATGCRIDPTETEGLSGEEWGKSVHTFYEPESAVRLHDKLQAFGGGRVVINFVEMPIKCPVAPLEFAFLLDAYLKRRGVRDNVDIAFVTPLDGAFTKPKASATLGHLLKEKGIEIITDFGLEKVDQGARKLISYDNREVSYDLLVSIPVNKGSLLISKSDLGDELDFIPTNPHTLQSKQHANVFVIGDATDVPASKAGSVAHFEAETVKENIALYIEGKELKPSFDGHANCFIETGGGKALLIDFNYDVEPLAGTFPLPFFGPLQLLKESRINHLGKLAFKWLYWNIIIKGLPIPFISHKMSMRGKKK